MTNIENELYFKEINKWRQGLDDALRRENSWLALSGLFWLKEGKNSIGSNPDCNIPPQAMPHPNMQASSRSKRAVYLCGSVLISDLKLTGS